MATQLHKRHGLVGGSWAKAGPVQKA
jgi:hypothetical protein